MAEELKETEIFRSKNNSSTFKYVFYNPKSPDFYDISKKYQIMKRGKLILRIKLSNLRMKILIRQSKN